MRKPKRFSDQLRQAIKEGQKSRYAISKITGIDQGNLSKLIHGTSGLSVESIDRLCECLELDLVKRPATNKKRQSEGD